MNARMIGTIRTTVPALLSVELRMTCTNGEKDARTLSTSPTQKTIVIAIIKARIELTAYAVNRDRGMTRDASFAFSAVKCQYMPADSLSSALTHVHRAIIAHQTAPRGQYSYQRSDPSILPSTRI
jgi:hypothetical protein